MNNQTKSVYDCVKPLPQRATKEVSLELREVSTLMSKPQQWACFNDTHRQCNDSPILIVLPISEPVRLLVHVQLVSLLQWHDNVFDNKQTFELVSILKPQWACFNGILNAMTYSFSSLYPSVNLVIRSRATSESATMTSPKSISSMSKSISEPASMTLSMQWPIRSHRSTHQWIDSPIRSCATSEPATMTLRQCNDLSSHRSTYQWTGLPTRSRATSESASMTLLPRIVSLLQ